MSAIVINVQGGVGKHVSFTGLIPVIAEKYDTIYVNTPYPDIFIGSPYITEINPKMDTEFYKNLMKKDSTKIVATDPYDQEEFIKKKIHLLDMWAKMCDVEIESGMDLKPKMFIGTEREKYALDSVIHDLKKNTKEKYILIQLNGGQSPHNFEQNGNTSFNFADEQMKRAYPFDYYIELVKGLKLMYPNHTIIRYGLSNEPMPTSLSDLVATIHPAVHYKNYQFVAEGAEKVVCIDSSLQHIVAGVKKAVVIWGETAPEHFGYSRHENIRLESNEETQPYARMLGPSTGKIEFPKPEDVLTLVKR